MPAKQINNGLKRVVTFSFLTGFTIFILASFIRYAMVSDTQGLTDVSLGWLSFYVALLT